jgi:GNAT superfamily N-acetyltransferase
VSLSFVTCAERPEVVDGRWPTLEAWPAFMLESPIGDRCWDLLYERFGVFQSFLVDDESGDVIAEVNSVPVRVDLEALPDRGWDDVIERGTAAEEAPNAVTAISVSIRPTHQRQGLSARCLERMRATAAANGFEHLVAPVRPSWKARYPLIPIDRYVGWTTSDGLRFDPWLRAHQRLGAEVVSVCHESMTIPGTLADWEGWTGLTFPESGDYVVPGALNLVRIERERDSGVYVEPNVWMHHRL